MNEKLMEQVIENDIVPTRLANLETTDRNHGEVKFVKAYLQNG